jgi:hypothetical protein
LAIQRLAPVAEAEAGPATPFRADDADIPTAPPHLVFDPGEVSGEPF